jgi:hypothetical protein
MRSEPAYERLGAKVLSLLLKQYDSLKSRA